MITATYIQHCGNDLMVVNAARVSFAKESAMFSDKDEGLISYLARHNHKSPFNHAFVTFHVKAPVILARQLVKHEYMPWNEVSRRYVDDVPELYVCEVLRGRSADKKQGSDGVVHTTADIEGFYKKALEVYKQQLVDGVCPEQARFVLPQAMMTEWYWSGTLFAFAKMCNLRCTGDTQLETRLVANQICDKMRELFPVSWLALRGL